MSLGAGIHPPLVAHDPEDRGAIVVVITHSLMFIPILFAIMRTWASHSHKRELRWDDLAFFLAVLLTIVESILTERAVNYGLGRHINNVAASRLVQYYKVRTLRTRVLILAKSRLTQPQYEYAAQILGILIQALAKSAVILMVERIANELSTKKLSLILKSTIAMWTLFSIFTIALQCAMPRPWEFIHEQCAASGKLYYVIIVGDIATDGVLACYIVPTILELQMSRYLKIGISSLFMTRLVVCAVLVGYVALFPEYLASYDKTWHNANVQILHQVAINLSVMTAGIPSVRSYLSEMQTGRLAMVLDDSEIEMTTRGSKSKGTNKSKKEFKQGSSRQSAGPSSSQDHDSGSHRQDHAKAMDGPQDICTRPVKATYYRTRITGGVSEDYAEETRDDARGVPIDGEGVTGDDQSTSSLVKNGMYQQRDFEAQYNEPR